MGANQSAIIRIMLSGQAAVVSGLGAVDRGVTRLERSTKSWGAAAEEGGRRGFLMNQILFTMRRYAYAGTLALTGLGAASIAMGIKFNASMETNRVALTQFLGSTKLANKELEYLYHLAAYTPFEFSNVTDAARRFLAFGFTLKETNANLATIGDTVAAFGGGGAEIERMVTVFGQIRASGRLLGQDLLQLEQQGIPVIDILSKKLAKYGVTRAMLSKPGALQIPSEIGIPALLSGMEERFKGASAIQAKTFTGQLSTFHDLYSQVMGGLTQAAFQRATGGLLPSVNKTLTKMGAIIRKQKGKITLTQVFGVLGKSYPQLKPLLDFLKLFIDYFILLGKVLKNDVLPVLAVLVIIARYTLYPALWLLLKIFQGLAKYAVIAIPIFTTFTGLLLIGAIQAWKVAKAEGALAKTRRFLTFWTNSVKFATKALVKVINGEALAWARARIQMLLAAAASKFASFKVTTLGRLLQALFTGKIIGKGGKFVQFTKLETAILNARRGLKKLIEDMIATAKVMYGRFITAIKDTAKAMWTWFVTAMKDGARVLRVQLIPWIIATARVLYTKLVPAFIREAIAAAAAWVATLGPIAWIIAGIVLLVAGLVILYFKWKWFHHLVQTVWHWIKDNWQLLAIILIAPFAPLLAAILLAIKYFKTWIGWVKSLVGWIAKIHMPTWGGLAKFFGITTQRANANNMPSWARPQQSGGGAIDPFGQTPVGASIFNQTKDIGKNPFHMTVHSVVNVDGKKMAENTAKHRVNKQARK